MDKNDLARKLALDTYTILVAELNDRGIIIDTLSSDDLNNLSVIELEAVNKRYQALVRNPIPRGS